MALDHLHWYSDKEEKLNIYSHLAGVGLSIFALILLIDKGRDYSISGATALFVYGTSQILIFASSSFYHSQNDPKKRYVANVVDHAMIFVSIAGTYTPFCLISMQDRGGISLLIIVWIVALTGMLLKLRFTGRYNLLSTLMYVGMGWLVIFYAREFYESLDFNGLMWLLAGGIAYTIGALIYMTDKIPFNHAIFHGFILLGSFCHFYAVYFYT